MYCTRFECLHEEVEAYDCAPGWELITEAQS
jgi:hypothetical protein